jgi:hypothetical protein
VGQRFTQPPDRELTCFRTSRNHPSLIPTRRGLEKLTGRKLNDPNFDWWSAPSLYSVQVNNCFLKNPERSNLRKKAEEPDQQ